MRIKNGKSTRRRHKKVLEATKGFRMTKNRLYKVAHEAYMHAGMYSYNDRKKRAGDMRELWILRTSAAAKLNGMSYSSFIGALKKANVELDRKSLADIAFNNPEVFTQIVKSI